MIRPYIIIPVNGKSGVGKDTVCEYIRIALVTTRIKPLEYSMVDPIKEIATECGWSGSKRPKDRDGLAELKFILSNWLDYPFTEFINFVSKHTYLETDVEVAKPLVIFVHAREYPDILRIFEAFGSHVPFVLWVDAGDRVQFDENISNGADNLVDRDKKLLLESGFDILTVDNSGDYKDIDVSEVVAKIKEVL
jgi:hypothetical protein